MVKVTTEIHCYIALSCNYVDKAKKLLIIFLLENTDIVLNSIFLQAAPEDSAHSSEDSAHSWANSFERLLEDPAGLHTFAVSKFKN